MAGIGDRGKYAEDVVKKKLKALESADTTHYRWPDTRAGSLKTAPADFAVMRRGRLFLLEVKQVQHGYRLPYPNFDLAQAARMRMWQHAGASPWVIVCHRTEQTLWRYGPLDAFEDRSVGGSWNLQTWNTYSIDEILSRILVSNT